MERPRFAFDIWTQSMVDHVIYEKDRSHNPLSLNERLEDSTAAPWFLRDVSSGWLYC